MHGTTTAVMDEPRMETPAPSFPRGQLLAEALGFVALTGGVFWWQLPAGQTPPALAMLEPGPR